MILEDKFQEEVKKYCEIKDIKIKNSRVSAKYISEIQQYIQDRLNKEREITKKQEESLSSSINFLVKDFLNTISGQILFSPIEDFLWDALEKNELSYMAKRQFEIGKYKIDIVFPIAKLAIECDGAEYHRANQLQLERDQKRDKYLARKGWRTLRIEGLAIRRDIIYCIERIKTAIGSTCPAGLRLK